MYVAELLIENSPQYMHAPAVRTGRIYHSVRAHIIYCCSPANAVSLPVISSTAWFPTPSCHHTFSVSSTARHLLPMFACQVGQQSVMEESQQTAGKAED